ncbi:unnamed protein product [Acidithrix sp. C25]|nr:unnamed protein product [Acidithrix sp. C25]
MQRKPSADAEEAHSLKESEVTEISENAYTLVRVLSVQ